MATSRRKGASADTRLRGLAALPLAAYLAVFLAYPILYAIRLAFTDASTGDSPTLANFAVLSGDALFWRALGNNVLLPVVGVLVELVLGLALALLFHQRFPGRSLLRAIAVIPFALPEVVYLTAMRYVFAERGYANAALASVGGGPVEFLAPQTWTAFVTVAAVDAWHVTPVVFLVIASALAGLPQNIFEAARLDGARGWRTLVSITLPLLRPALFMALMLRGLDALRVFAAPLVLTGVEGVPVLSSYAYHQWSDYGDDGVSAAAAVVLALLGLIAAAPLVGRRGRA
jgi:multiple sugar transport system permease protein